MERYPLEDAHSSRHRRAAGANLPRSRRASGALVSRRRRADGARVSRRVAESAHRRRNRRQNRATLSTFSTSPDFGTGIKITSRRPIVAKRLPEV